MTPDRYTYRFVHNSQASETHSEDVEELLRRAVDHLERGFVLPVHIRRGREVLYSSKDIVLAWSREHLEDAPGLPRH